MRKYEWQTKEVGKASEINIWKWTEILFEQVLAEILDGNSLAQGDILPEVPCHFLDQTQEEKFLSKIQYFHSCHNWIVNVY